MKYEVEKDFLKSAIILKETSNFENRARGNFSFFLSVIYYLDHAVYQLQNLSGIL